MRTLLSVVIAVLTVDAVAVAVLWQRAVARLDATRRQLAVATRRSIGWQSMAERRAADVAGAETCLWLALDRNNHLSARNAALTDENLQLAAGLRDVRERLAFADIIAGQPAAFFLPSEQIGDES